MKIQRGTSLERWRDRHEPRTLSTGRYRTDTNVCGHAYNLQIRFHVSHEGPRSPSSISRYSRTLMPSRHAACPIDQPARLRSFSSMPGNAATDRA